jgi:hypothetical protein
VISLLVPTRERPVGLARLEDSARATALDPAGVEIVAYVDDDDHGYDDWTGTVTFVRGPRRNLSECWNLCQAEATGPIYGHMGDDIVFRTSGWDRWVENVFARYEDRIVFVHGEDGIQGQRIGTHGFLHQRWIDAVGYFVPPYFSSDYNDLWLTEVADAIDRRVYIPQVLTEHLHYSVGKSEIDQNTLDRLQRHAEDDVSSLYQSLDGERAVDAAKLREVMIDGS